MRTYPSIGVQIPRLLLPKPGVDLEKWAVVACDQFTSQPEYWQQVAGLVGSAPSTYHMILPEVFLGKPEERARLKSIQKSMHNYLEQGLLLPHEGLVLVERSVAGHTRHGLMLALDLEHYDYNPGSQTLIRATEGTILDRLPPRIKIRQGAPLEIPHILVLIDDPGCTVIEPLFAHKVQFERIYDTDLMLNSGHLSGYLADNLTIEYQVMNALKALADPAVFQKKYGVNSTHHPLLFAMGDGNHSFATAKAIWEQIKSSAVASHPARYALVEIENVHDEGLIFEPIHRVIFDLQADPQTAMQSHWGEAYSYAPCQNLAEMVAEVDRQAAGCHQIGLITAGGCGVATIANPSSHLPVGTLQTFLDQWQTNGGFSKIDYVHGHEVTANLGAQPGNAGFYLPAMPKSDLFKTVILDGALPRKTFSMGEAIEKRFYMECRQIAP